MKITIDKILKILKTSVLPKAKHGGKSFFQKAKSFWKTNMERY